MATCFPIHLQVLQASLANKANKLHDELEKLKEMPASVAGSRADRAVLEKQFEGQIMQLKALLGHLSRSGSPTHVPFIMVDVSDFALLGLYEYIPEQQVPEVNGVVY